MKRTISIHTEITASPKVIELLEGLLFDDPATNQALTLAIAEATRKVFEEKLAGKKFEITVTAKENAVLARARKIYQDSQRMKNAGRDEK